MQEFKGFAGFSHENCEESYEKTQENVEKRRKSAMISSFFLKNSEKRNTLATIFPTPREKPSKIKEKKGIAVGNSLKNAKIFIDSSSFFLKTLKTLKTSPKIKENIRIKPFFP